MHMDRHTDTEKMTHEPPSHPNPKTHPKFDAKMIRYIYKTMLNDQYLHMLGLPILVLLLYF